MTKSLLISVVNPAVGSTAEQIHRVWMQAYSQEALLLGARTFPPLRVTIEDLRASTETFFAAFVGQELVGSTSVERGVEGTNITSMVVAPAFQRRGAASQLLAEVLRSYGSSPITVQTGVKNAPALALYAKAGFVPIEHWVAGPEQLQLVKLHRPPGYHLARPDNAA